MTSSCIFLSYFEDINEVRFRTYNLFQFMLNKPDNFLLLAQCAVYVLPPLNKVLYPYDFTAIIIRQYIFK